VADIARPALAEVLAAITTRPVGHWRAEVSSPAFVGVERVSPRGVRWTVRVDPHRATTQTRHASLRQTEPAYEARRVGNTLTRVEVAPAHTITPAGAVEALTTVGLWPWEIGDERAPRWWCEFLNDAIIDDPPSHAALVAVASLGRPLLQRITHTLVPWIARAAGCPDARVVWRVMGLEALLRHHEVTAREGDGWGCVYVSSHEHERARRPQSFGKQPAWPNACPWPSLAQVDAAWPALRRLAVGDEATPQPTGVHLVALDASRVVLAVEAIGGDR